MTIPTDILAAARAVLTAPKHATRPHTELLLRIAGAIEGERKRCASVARHLNGWGADCGKGGHAEHIAKIIERGRT